MYERGYGIERQETSGVFQWKPEQKQYIETNRRSKSKSFFCYLNISKNQSMIELCFIEDRKIVYSDFV
jgi:hypothetical protein